MAIIKCKMCGGDLSLVEGQTVAECDYCGSRQTVPTADNEKKLTLFARANRLRLGCEFDKAAGIYESIVADFSDEAEAYWGLVLCKYGIEYVDDPGTGKKIPTCHRSSFESIMEDSDFEQALENADAVARRVYREEAKQIEEIRKGIIAVSANEEPYDIFICYKETDEKGDRTLDSVLAQDIYDALTDKGYRTFFARITLEDKLGMEYEPYIFAALNSAKIMLAVGTDYEYYNAVWVKNEWSRFLKQMAKDRSKHLIPCFKTLDAYDMPKEFARLQAQDLGKVGAMQDLLRGIEKILPRQLENAKDAVVVQQSTVVPVTAPLLKRAYLFLEDEDWGSASEYCEKVLDIDPENGQAYLVKLMAFLKVKQVEQLQSVSTPFLNVPAYKNAVRFGDEKLKKDLIAYSDQVARECLKKAYVAAQCAMAEAKTEEAFLSVAEQFETISHYQDSAALAEACRNKVEYIRQQNLLSEKLAKLFDVNDGVITKYIGDEADVEIPGCITRIKNYAFRKCDKIRSLTIYSEGIEIEESAFREAPNLQSVKILGKDTDIGYYAFFECKNLRTVELGADIVSIGMHAFSGCEALTAITIPASVKTIVGNVFSGCTNLQQITVADGNPHYQMVDKCLIDVRKKEVVCMLDGGRIPDDGSICSIGYSAVSGIKTITSLALPSGITQIGAWAFSGCEGIRSITLPDSVKKIGAGAFGKCKNLREIVISDGNSSFAMVNGNLIDIEKKELRCALPGTQIPRDGSITSIGSHAFHGQSDLESVTVPGCVKIINKSAFYECESLKTITIEEGVRDIADSAFSGCKALTSVNIPGTVESIGEWAFSFCENLCSVTIPGSVGSIEKYAFHKCEKLETVTMQEGVQNIANSSFNDCKALTSVTIPGSVESINVSAFGFCNNLRTVTVLEGVKRIDDRLWGCDALKNLYLPMSVTEIKISGLPKSCVIHSNPNSYAKTWADKNRYKWEADEETKRVRREEEREKTVRAWKAIGRCQHCGGELKGLFGKKCVKCGKPKDY